MEKENIEKRPGTDRVDMLRVGVISSTHGIHGEVKVYPTTDDKNRFLQLKKIYLDMKNELFVADIEGVKFFKDMVILKLSLFQTPEEAALYKNCDLLIDRKDAVTLEEDEYFICDLIGLQVISDEEEVLGTISEILQTGANDVIEVTNENETPLLIPYIEDCVLSVSLEEKVMRVHLLPGLRAE